MAPSQLSIRMWASPFSVSHSPVGWGSAAAAKTEGDIQVSKNVAAQITGNERMSSPDVLRVVVVVG
jgi:hypothetical protein